MIFCDRSPRATGLQTWAMSWTWALRSLSSLATDMLDLKAACTSGPIEGMIMGDEPFVMPLVVVGV